MVIRRCFKYLIALHTGRIAKDHQLMSRPSPVALIQQLLAEPLQPHVKGHDFMQDMPAPGFAALPNTRRRGQSEIKPDDNCVSRLRFQVLVNHRAVIVLRPDRTAFLHIDVLRLKICPDPVKVLATNLLIVITRRQIVVVFAALIDAPVLAGAENCLAVLM